MVYSNYFSISNIIVLILTFLLISSCCSTNETSKQNELSQSSYKKLAEDRFNKNYKVMFNQDSTYLIVQSTRRDTAKNFPSQLNFFVYNSTERKIIYEDNLSNGNVKWINKNQLKVTTNPEVIKGKYSNNEDVFGYIYDVSLKKKVVKKEETEN
jgi:hypothetical protein